MKETFILMRYIAASLFTYAMLAAPALASEINIGLDSISPQPVDPGRDLVLSIALANEGSDAEDVILEILPYPPVILKNNNDRIKNIGNIIKNGALVKTYQLHIDPLAVSGVYDIDFRTRWSSSGQQREFNNTFKVFVRGVPQLVISNISISPEMISPADMFDFSFLISNEGTGTAQDIQVREDITGLPFVPVGADTKIIKKLNPGESSQLSFSALVKDKTEISSYSLPVKMDYKDENGKNISSQSSVGIRVNGKAELAIENIKTDPQNPADGDSVTVTMRIENLGNGDARSVKVGLDIPFEGTKTAFLGRIKPDDDAPAVFSIFINKSGNIPYFAAIEFEDDLGKHNLTESLSLHVRNANKSSFVSPVGAVLLVAACAYYLSRRKKH